MEGKKLRIVSVREEFENEGKTSVGFNRSINEILPPDRNRYVYEERTANGTIERTEYIDIGDKSFVRRNGGEWEILVPSGMGNGAGNGAGGIIPKVEISIVKSLIKNETVNNQSADLYKTVESRKYIYPDKTYTNVSIESFWFDRDGKLVKSIREFQDGERKSISRTTEEFDYNANFKIEAPTIKTKKNPR